MIAKEQNIVNFTASDGWITNVNKRNGLIWHSVSGESANVDEEGLKMWREQVLYPTMRQFDPSDVFNTDESGLFYEMMPDKTLDFSSKFKIKGICSIF